MSTFSSTFLRFVHTPGALPTMHTRQAPINPSDINCVEGKYPVKPPLPAIAGFEGVARVRAVGGAVQSCAPGDWVIPTAPAQGTWRATGIFPAANWHRVANDIPVDAAATLFVKYGGHMYLRSLNIPLSPPSALRMLEEFVDLQPGDVVVQNAANSAVGQYVVQMAKDKGLRTINVVRPRCAGMLHV